MKTLSIRFKKCNYWEFWEMNAGALIQANQDPVILRERARLRAWEELSWKRWEERKLREEKQDTERQIAREKYRIKKLRKQI